MNKKTKKRLKKIWYFIWEDDSIWSWIVNIILAFVLIKYLVYPGLGLILSTSFPIVAVVSESMEHNNQNFDKWWDNKGGWYEKNDISKTDFLEFKFKNGFNKGDIIFLKGRDPKDIEVGDVIVFKSHHTKRPKPDPIIHRIIKKQSNNSIYSFQTKGDKNKVPIKGCDEEGCLDETNIKEGQIIGAATIKIPLLGYIKIWFVDYIKVPYCRYIGLFFCGG